MHAASMIFSSYMIVGELPRQTARTDSRKSPSLSFMMLALWMAVTFLAFVPARVLETQTGQFVSTRVR